METVKLSTLLPIEPATKRTVVVTLSVGQVGKELLALTGESMRRYAAKIGSDFRILSHVEEHAAPLTFKFSLGKVLDQWERFIFIDADALVHDHTPNLFDVVPVDSLGIYDDLPDLGRSEYGKDWYSVETEYLKASQGLSGRLPYCLNTGVIVASRCHRPAFDKPAKPFKWSHCAEQTLIGINIERANLKIFPLPLAFNAQWWSFKYTNEFRTAYVQHFSGLASGHKDRLNLIECALNKSGTKNFLINLERRPDRKQRSLLSWIATGLETPTIVEAIDGKLLTDPNGFKSGLGALGCKLSHLKVFNTAFDKGLLQIGVFEDDVTFVPKFKEKFAEFMDSVPSDWDAIFLGGQHMVKPQRIGKGVLKCYSTHRTHAYLIRGTYLHFIQSVFEVCDRHIDHCFGQVQEAWNVYAPESWLCGQDKGRSDINNRINDVKFWNPKLTDQPNKPCLSCGKNRK